MQLRSGGFRRVLYGVAVLGLAVAAQAGVAPARAAAAGTAGTAAPTVAAHPRAARPSAVVRPKARKLAVDPREQAWRSRFLAHPAPAPMASAAAVPAATTRRLASATARHAVRQAAVSTCSGQIAPDTLYSCQAPSATGTDTYTLTLPAGSNVLVFQTTDPNGIALPITVTAPDATTLSCQQSPVDECVTNQQGTYTVAVASDGISYTLEYTALLTEANCPALSLSFASSSQQGSLTAGQAGDCYSFSAPSGDILYTYAGPGSSLQVDAAIFDAAGNLVCAQVMGDCTLTGTGPYRVLASAFGQAGSYEFQVADLTNPSGCALVPQQVFGQVPALSTDLCSSLTVTTAGSYQIYSADKGFATVPGTLYLPGRAQACTGTGWTCQLAAGTYDFIRDYLLDGAACSSSEPAQQPAAPPGHDRRTAAARACTRRSPLPITPSASSSRPPGAPPPNSSRTPTLPTEHRPPSW